MTAIPSDNDNGSLWIVKEAEIPSEKNPGENQLPCRTGYKFKCGEFIRFEHMNTGRNLHSHSGFDAPVSRRQEVSGFGDNGDGDGGNHYS